MQLCSPSEIQVQNQTKIGLVDISQDDTAESKSDSIAIRLSNFEGCMTVCQLLIRRI